MSRYRDALRYAAGAGPGGESPSLQWHALPSDVKMVITHAVEHADIPQAYHDAGHVFGGVDVHPATRQHLREQWEAEKGGETDRAKLTAAARAFAKTLGRLYLGTDGMLHHDGSGVPRSHHFPDPEDGGGGGDGPPPEPKTPPPTPSRERDHSLAYAREYASAIAA